MKVVHKWKLGTLAAIGLLLLVGTAAYGQDQEGARFAALATPEGVAGGLPASEHVVIISSHDAWLGVHASDVTPEKMAELKLKEEYGALVTEVEEGSPAAAAGLRKNDVILEFQGERVESVAELQRLVRETPPGRTVRLLVSRDGRVQTLTAKLERREHVREQIRIPWLRIPEFEIKVLGTRPRLGISGDELTPQLAEYFGVKQGKGVLVREVMSGSPAQKAGVKAGDVIVRLDGATIEDMGDLRRVLGEKKGGDTVTLTIVREGAETTLKVQLEEMRRAPRRVTTYLEGWRDWQRDYQREMRELREKLREHQRELQKEMRQLRLKLRERVTI